VKKTSSCGKDFREEDYSIGEEIENG